MHPLGPSWNGIILVIGPPLLRIKAFTLDTWVIPAILVVFKMAAAKMDKKPT